MTDPDPVEEAVEAAGEALHIAIRDSSIIDWQRSVGTVLDSLASSPEGKKVLLARALSEEERGRLAGLALLAAGEDFNPATETQLRALSALLSPGVEDGA